MDIQVVYLRDVLNVTSVTNVPDMVPRTLDVRGPDFRSVDRVEVNEEDSPSFIVMSSKRILAQVPPSQEQQAIRSISVLSSRFTKTDRSQVKFEFTNHPKRATGLIKLIQTFLLYLMRTPGTDAWYPNSGGGVMRLIGSTFSRNQTGGVAADFTTAVSRTRTQIMALQASRPRLASSEKLAGAQVLQAIFSPEQTALLARVELSNQSGERAIVGLEL